MTMIRNDEELAVQRELLGIVERIVESWRKKLLPDHPKNFAIYAEGAIEEAEKLRAQIDDYLQQKSQSIGANAAPQPPAQQPTSVT